MKIEGVTLGKILRGHERIIIPKYQREYAWAETEAREFVDDLHSAVQADLPLFMGTFIFSRQSREKLDIVDGQQRFTTVMIFLIACRNYAKKFGKKGTDLVDNIQRRLTLQDATYGSEVQQRLEPSKRISGPFQVMIQRGWDGEYSKDMGSKHDWNRISKVYKFFVDKLDEMNLKKEEVQTMLTILEQVQIVEIVVEDGADSAIETFERVNARGAHLAVYDLVKAYLFAKLNESEEISIEEEWKQIQRYSEDSDNKLKKLLHQFRFVSHGYVNPRKLYRELRRMADIDVHKFLAELKDYAKFVSIVSGFSSNKGTGKLGFNDAVKTYLIEEKGLQALSDSDRIKKVQYSLSTISSFGVVSVYPLIYASLKSLSRGDKGKKDVDAWIEFLDFLERFSFVTTSITHISAQKGGQLEKIYGDGCEAFSEGKKKFLHITQDLKKRFQGIEVLEQDFINRFTQIGYSTSDYPLIIYIFDKLNRYSPSEKGKFTHPGNSHYIWSTDGLAMHDSSIEHIFPQSRAEELGDPQNVHDVGNLLVVHRKDNSKLGDMKSDKKLEWIVRAIKDGKIQNKPYLKQFVDEYEDKLKDWDESSIQNRTVDIATRIWKIVDFQSS